jgi:hypothetical protein
MEEVKAPPAASIPPAPAKDPKAALAALQGLLAGTSGPSPHATILAALDKELARIHETIQVSGWWGRATLHALLQHTQQALATTAWHWLEAKPKAEEKK